MNRDMSETNSINNRAKIVGILFIIGTAAGILGAIIISPVLNATDYLAKFSADQNQVLAGVFLELVMAVACASIAIWLYPV
jgi:Na+/glutamate symporter